MSRLATRDSNYSGFNRGDRIRSGSPSEYYRHQMGKKDQLFDKVYNLKTFIHDGIEKFLDKQAVRDLIVAYDSDDIFVRGELEFFQSFDEERNVLDNEENEMNNNNTVHNNNHKFLVIPRAGNNGFDRKKFQVLAERVNEMDRMNREAAAKSMNPVVDVFGKMKRERTNSLLTTFISMIGVKLFYIKRTKSAARRRESEFFNQTMNNLKR